MPFGKPQCRDATPLPHSAVFHGLANTLAVAAVYLDVPVQVHVPANEGNAEVLTFADPFEPDVQGGQGHDVRRGLVIGDQDVGGSRRDFLRTFNLNLAARQAAQLELCPPARIAVQEGPRGIERCGHGPDHQRTEEKDDRRSTQEGPVEHGKRRERPPR